MDFIPFLVVLLTGVVCFVLRAASRIRKPLLGHDTWSILLIVDELKKGHGYNGVCKYYLIEGNLDYPPLFFYFLSLFPSSWLRKWDWVINPALDSINAAISSWLAYVLTKDLLLALTAGLIYSFTPAVLEESLNLNARVFGLIFFNLTMTCLVLYYQSANLLYAASAIASGVIVLLSHKFATQVLYALLPFLAVLNWSYETLLILFGMVLGAILVSKSFYLAILRGHVAMIRFWIKNQSRYGSRYLQSKGSTGAAKTMVKQVDGPQSKFSISQLWRRTSRVNPLYWMLGLSPFNPFALVVVLVPFLGIQMSWENLLVQWSILTLVFYYAATYVRSLGHYAGRSQFMEYNSFPTALVCALFLWSPFSYSRLAVFGVVLLLSMIQNVRSWRRVSVYSRSDDQTILMDIFDYMRKSDKDGVICLPSSHTFAVPYFAGKRVFYTMSAEKYEKLEAFFPVLTVPVERLSQQYGISFVIVDSKVVDPEELGLSSFKLVMERDGYMLFEKAT